MTPDRWCLADRRLYLCTADRPDLERFVDACIRGGVDVVQLREKHLDDRALVERALVVQRVCAFHRTPFILNDRPDLAASIGADGVHVGQDDQTPIEARRLVGDEAIIGLSTHSPTELDAAIGTLAPAPGGPGSPVPIQYISAGPVVPTPTKPGRPGTGLGYVGQAVERAPWPVWITGGVDPTSVLPMVDAGARHFVVVRWLTEAADPGDRARRLRLAIEGAIERADQRASRTEPDDPPLTGDR
ncbi:MAG: thiamine phosphate synthase [Acidimicrobiales bacterium]